MTKSYQPENKIDHLVCNCVIQNEDFSTLTESPLNIIAFNRPRSSTGYQAIPKEETHGCNGPCKKPTKTLAIIRPYASPNKII